MWDLTRTPCRSQALLKFLTVRSKDLSGHWLLFHGAHRREGPSFPSTSRLLASQAQTMRILTVWWNQPKKAGD